MKDEDIINLFNKEDNTYNFNKTTYGIFTNDTRKANMKIKELYYKFGGNQIKALISTEKYKVLILKDGTRFRWINFNEDTRSIRCGKAIIDRNIDLKELQTKVLPMCYSCDRNDIELF